MHPYNSLNFENYFYTEKLLSEIYFDHSNIGVEALSQMTKTVEFKISVWF